MLNALAAVLSAVVDYPVSLFKTERLGDLGDFFEDVRDRINVAVVYLVRAADVLLGDNENVYGSLGLKVIKREDFVVLINLF